jgi:hypothetical protein
MQQYIGIGAAILASGTLGNFLIACSDNMTDPTQHATLDLTTEIGVLNFVYAVLQLETDFYGRVDDGKFPGMLASEASQFSTFQSDATAARDDMRVAEIPRGRITDAVLFTLGRVVDFASRTDVLTHAQIIEDAAARGLLAALALVQTPTTVTLITNLASAAAARSAAIRVMAGASSLSITPQSPSDVMSTLAPYYLTTFTIHA